ncbi:UNVERIFIED_CONTAM: hypothetical protein GTU68_066908 [Idotea baltica]|nr:hypothetical protein [Idotea baltica]
MTSPLLHPRDHAWHPKALAPAYKSSVLRSPRQPLLSFGNTATELTGPTFGPEIIGPLDHDLIRNFAAAEGSDASALGPRILVHGQLKDEGDRPVPNALIEIWQANAGGRYRHVNDGYLAPLDPNFGGCGRCLTDDQGRYRFITIQPETVKPRPLEGQAPHVALWIVARGVNLGLNTRIYFPDEDNGSDPLLSLAGSRSETLIARRPDAEEDERDQGMPVYRFDIHIQGEQETVFIDV